MEAKWVAVTAHVVDVRPGVQRTGRTIGHVPKPLRDLGFPTIGLFDEDDPRRGHESTLAVIELGERLGFDSAWVRHRHLRFGISSPVAVLQIPIDIAGELGPALGWHSTM